MVDTKKIEKPVKGQKYERKTCGISLSIFFWRDAPLSHIFFSFWGCWYGNFGIIQTLGQIRCLCFQKKKRKGNHPGPDSLGLHWYSSLFVGYTKSLSEWSGVEDIPNTDYQIDEYKIQKGCLLSGEALRIFERINPLWSLSSFCTYKVLLEGLRPKTMDNKRWWEYYSHHLLPSNNKQ